MVYDSIHKQVVLFGGYGEGVYNDTWLWDGVSWKQAYPLTNPPARAGHAMAYDSVRQQVVLFGGYNSSFAELDDTWVWDGVNWAQAALATNPAARDGASMAFDAAHSQIVLFGGGTRGISDLADTWTWDGVSWTAKFPTTSPLARDSAGMAYSSTLQRVVLFGGAASSEVGFGDTWTWNGTNWTLSVPATSPPARGAPGVAYDAARGLVVLFGGKDLNNSGISLSDTWTFDGTTWTQFVPSTVPPPRSYTAFAFDALHGETVMFGGQSSAADTWVLGPLTVFPTSLPDATKGANYRVQYSASGGVPYYSFTVSGLPPGLSVSSGNLIVGQCTGQSSTGVIISVLDNASPTHNTVNVGPLTLHCNPAPVITNASPLPMGVVNVNYSATFTTNATFDPPGAAPYQWSLNSGTLPDSFVLNSSGVLTGVATTGTTANFSVTFTDFWGATTTKAYQLSFNQPLTISTIALPSGTAGTAYAAGTSIAATGGSGSGTYVFSASGLPPGLSINANTGLISGTPTQTGGFTPVFTVTDLDTQMAQATLALTVAAAQPIIITTASTLFPAFALKAYSTQIQWTGGSGGFSVTGTSVPSWLTISNAGLLSGTPPGPGTFSFTLTVTDSQTPAHNASSKTFALTATAPAITTASPLPAATIGVAYSATLSATGVAPFSWSGVSLPAWLSLSSAGILSGTPPLTTSSPVSITVQVTDASGGSSTGTCLIPVITPASLMFISASPLMAATAGAPYSVGLSVQGGVAPYTFTGTSLPSWLTLSSSGNLTGIAPPAAGTATFTVTTTDSASNRVTAAFTVPINAMLTVGTASLLPRATIGSAYSQIFSASGGDAQYSWSPSGLPIWANLNSAGVLTGTPPPGAAASSFTVTVSDGSNNTASKLFNLPVDLALTMGTTSPLLAATLNAPYMATLTASGGGGVYVWSSSGLPSGFALSSTGMLTGTPTSTTTIAFMATVTDSLNNALTKPFNLPVNSVLIISNTSPLPSVIPGSVYSLQFVASGGWGPYSWAANGLPSWLTLTTAGFLTGVPPSSAATIFPVTVTDSLSHTATASFTLSANSPVMITTTSSLVSISAGSAFSQQLLAAGGSGSYVWSGSGLPSWLSISSSGLLFGTPPPISGSVTFSVTAVDAANTANGATQVFVLPILSPVPLSIVTLSPLPAGIIGTAYAQQFTGSGGSGLYTWSATGLPASFTLNASGLLAGMPIIAGSYTLSVNISDNRAGLFASQPFTFVVYQALTISTTTLSPASAGRPYSMQLVAAGGASPYTWTGTGVPSWLSLSASGLLTGQAPSAASTTSFSATVMDSGGRTASQAFSLQVSAPLVITSTSPLTAGTANTLYSAVLGASGGIAPYSWAGTGLPSWLSLSTLGTLTGTPPIAGAFTFGATVTDAASTAASKQFTILVATGVPLSLVTLSLPPCAAGVPCSTSLTAAGGVPPYSFALTGAPSTGSLTLSTSGTLNGTFTTAGSVPVAVQLTDAAQTVVSRTFSLQVVAPLLITAPASATGATGIGFTLTPTASQGAPPYTWSIVSGSLPPGITLSSTTGVLSGIPTAQGPYPFTIQVTDSTAVIARAMITLLITAPVLSIQTASPLVAGAAGTSYLQTFQAINGAGSLGWSITGGALPPGLALSPAGLLSGMPTLAGDFIFILQVIDSSGASASQTYQLHIGGPLQPPPSLTATLSATVNAGDQPMVNIVLGNPYPLPIVATAVLSLAPSPSSTTDLLFPNGTRTIQFNIPAYTTQASLPFQAGTLAGTIQILFSLQAAGVDITPSPAPSVTTQIAVAVPVVKSVSVSLTNGGFALTISGVSNSREMKTAALHFMAATNATLQLTDASLDVSTQFSQWYGNAVSFPTGSQFQMIIPILLGGASTSIATVSVVITNSVGASSPVTATIQ